MFFKSSNLYILQQKLPNIYPICFASLGFKIRIQGGPKQFYAIIDICNFQLQRQMVLFDPDKA